MFTKNNVTVPLNKLRQEINSKKRSEEYQPAALSHMICRVVN